MIIPEQTKYFIVFIFRIWRPKYVRKRYFRKGVTGCKTAGPGFFYICGSSVTEEKKGEYGSCLVT